MSNLNCGKLNATERIQLPVYTNANRPAGNLGDLIFNSTEGTVQIYNGTECVLLKQYLKYLAEHSLVLVDIPSTPLLVWIPCKSLAWHH